MDLYVLNWDEAALLKNHPLPTQCCHSSGSPASGTTEQHDVLKTQVFDQATPSPAENPLEDPGF